jgi:hypothetical protein
MGTLGRACIGVPHSAKTSAGRLEVGELFCAGSLHMNFEGQFWHMYTDRVVSFFNPKSRLFVNFGPEKFQLQTRLRLRRSWRRNLIGILAMAMEDWATAVGALGRPLLCSC